MNNQHNDPNNNNKTNNPFHNNTDKLAAFNKGQQKPQQGDQGAQGQKTDGSQQGSQPVVSLPKGGGAIKGIGEKFQANPVTGTGSFTVPIAMSPGRGGFQPQLGLSYNSGGGNSPYGLGWNIGLPSITRKTDKGIPQYLDIKEIPAGTGWQGGSDTFILSGAEDLVPKLKPDGSWDTGTEGGHNIFRYTPRTEGLFAKIERWYNTVTGHTHWRATTKENITSIYGETEQARISHPDDPKKVFQWLVEKTYDRKGNLIEYEYKAEDGVNAPKECYESNRNSAANKYLKTVKYGNTAMYSIGSTYTGDWLFRLVLDYGEHANNTAVEDTTWPSRQDPYSTYKAGFEVRTYRLCKRVLMFHNFSDHGGQKLVKATELTHDENPYLTTLVSVTHRSHGETGNEAFPPLEFKYSGAELGTKLHTVDKKYLGNIPNGLEGNGYTWADLHGEGISGILKQDAHAWYYKPNLGDEAYYENQAAGGNPDPELKLGGLKRVQDKPSTSAGGGHQLTDLDGNGQLDLIVRQGHLTGYYALNDDGRWENFRTFKNNPNIDWQDPNMKMLDVNGDGHADILISEERCFTCYYNKTKDGFEPAKRTGKALNEDQGPAIVFADHEQSIFLADMSGDGMADIVRIRHNSVCYWPNMGHGRFGGKVLMKNSPMLDSRDMFRPQRVKLSDVDGTGTTDIIYLSAKGARYWKNQAGNAWGGMEEIKYFPASTDMDNVSVVDLLGNGTSCLVWSTPMPSGKGNVRYIELTNGIKPYLLIETNNNMGGITRMQYAPSTKFYLKDKADGKPWITKLPFPVQVLERTETYDEITGNKFVNLYAYHHGYFDGFEREFRGFGMVEQWDTEQYEFANASLFDAEGANINENSYIPPTYTKTWFHNGYYGKRHTISEHYKTEYYQGDPGAWLLEDTILPEGLSFEEQREAARALKGSILRQEVYAQDDSDAEAKPYTVEEKSYYIRTIQNKGNNKHAVFHVIDDEVLSYHYERGDDPRVAQQLNLETDTYGNILKAATIAYPRRASAGIDGQDAAVAQLSETDFINEDDPAEDIYFIGVPCESRQYELSIPNGGSKLLKEDLFSNGSIVPTRTLAAKTRNYFCSKVPVYTNPASTELNLGEIACHGLPYRSYTLAYTDANLQFMLDNSNNAQLAAFATVANLKDKLKGTSGLLHEMDSELWAKSGMQEYDPAKFHMPIAKLDPMGNRTALAYDSYSLLIDTVTDTENFETKITNNYHYLQPEMIEDVNNNFTEVGFDNRGMVAAVAIKGKKDGNGEFEGDVLTDPTEIYQYDLFNWKNNGKPNYVTIHKREQHKVNPWSTASTQGMGLKTGWLESITYSDGLGNEAMTKVQAEDGISVIASGATQSLTLAETQASGSRWAVSGRVILNNKGKAWKQFEPYFTESHEFDNYHLIGNANDFIKCSINSYDPVGRLIRTDMPDGTFTKVEFDPWRQENWDANDTVLQSQWYADRNSPAPNGAEPTDPNQRAAFLSAQHAATPQIVHFDVLGRAVRTDDHNKIPDPENEGEFLDEFVSTELTLDIKGNVLQMTDALGQAATTNYYSILGQPIYTSNIDSGKRFMLANAANMPCLTWDSKGNQFSNYYDSKLRPEYVLKYDGNINKKVSIHEYGLHANHNSIDKIYKIFDQSGLAQFTDYDFKGNPITMEKSMAGEYVAELNYYNTVNNSPETFVQHLAYDALNRPVAETLPDGTKQAYTYNRAGLLEKVEVQLRGTGSHGAYVSNINYNARGQRTEVYYGNGSKTKYEYDENNFRLTRLLTTRNTGQDILQDISYTYDAVGNIVETNDLAQQTHYFNNAVIEPKSQFWYDALYRLVKATGREKDNIGSAPTNADLAATTPVPYTGSENFDNYTHYYDYDKLGNIQEMQSANKWTRDYMYDANNLNRLLKHDDQQTTDDYTYDAHGNMLQMPNIPTMEWDYQDQLRTTISGTITAYYNYDSGGERARKVAEKSSGIREERIYFGNFEVYRKYVSNVLETERRTLHISDGTKNIAFIDTLTIENGTAVATLQDVVRYQHDNHLGSASLELDETAATISYEEYHPFGTSSFRMHKNDSEASLKRYRYVGKERDEETGLYYYGARYYAAWIGRWTAVDPMANERVWLNPYNYCQNNPINRTDPTGALDDDPQDGNENEKKKAHYPKAIQKKIDEGYQWAYTFAAQLDIWKEQVSFKRMDIMEGHDNKTFNSYHFLRITNFYLENAKKEKDGNVGEGNEDYKLCSPSMYYGINALYNWNGSEKIKSGYVVDYKDPQTKKTTKGIVSKMKEKNLVGAEKKFVAVDEEGVAGHYSDSKAVEMNESVAGWAKDKTSKGGVGIFIVSAIGGYHSLILIADRRGEKDSYRLLDQHGNEETGSKSSFDRTIAHNQKEIDDYFVKMANSWGEKNKNYSFNLYELKRD